MGTKTTQGMIDKLFERLEEVLPHGSGINGDWEFKFMPGTKNVRMSNYYHVMENGSYVYPASFTAIMNWKDPEYFNLQFHGQQAQYYARKHDLRSYLTDTICESLSYNFGEDDLGDNLN